MPQEVEAYVNDKSDNAYEKVVDRLMKSPRFGEHWPVPSGWTWWPRDPERFPCGSVAGQLGLP